jgi:hypothetical protein
MNKLVLVILCLGIAVSNSLPAWSQHCYEEILLDCFPGTSTHCTHSTCITWYLNSSNEWVTTPIPGARTKKDCAMEWQDTYLNEGDISYATPTMGGGGLATISVGGDVECYVLYFCGCKNIPLGNPCQQELENRIVFEEITESWPSGEECD